MKTEKQIKKKIKEIESHKKNANCNFTWYWDWQIEFIESFLERSEGELREMLRKKKDEARCLFSKQRARANKEIRFLSWVLGELE